MAQVSGIEVRFTGDTSGLEKSVNRAQSVISGFAKSTIAGLAGALSVGMFVQAGQAALNFADDIGKMAQKVGMSTEALSKLTYAAKLSDVSMQELQVGVQQLAKNMEAGSEGLTALGISATDSAGNLRSTAEVFADVAEAFSTMEDGAGKTAIAMNIFGRSGAQLIPLLNSGRAGLAQMGEEARRLGVVISSDAAKGAETFNDNITRLQEGLAGLTQKAIAPLLPKLIDLTEAFLQLSDSGTSLEDWFTSVYRWFEGLDPRIAATRKEIELISTALENLGLIEGTRSMKSDFQGVMPGQGGLSASPDDLNSMLASIDGSGKATAPSLGGGKESSQAKDDGMRMPGIPGSAEVDAFYIDRLAAIQEGFKTEREILMEEYAANQEVLQGALDNQLLSEQQYYDLSQRLAEEHQKTLADLQAARLDGDLAAASSFFSSMASAAQSGGKKMLKVAKATAAAQAIVDTIRAAVSAMNDPTAVTLPQKLANYALVFAKGMSAVAAIKGVSDGGGGGSGGGGGGAGGGGGRGMAGASAGGGSGGGGGPMTTFQFTLTNDPMGFGEKFARQFIDQLNATQRNGGTIRGVIA